MRASGVFILGIVLATAHMSAHASTWYVDQDCTARNQNGRGWNTAFATVQQAIDAAHKDGGGDVWVAESVYGESRKTKFAKRRTGSLLLRSGVNLYGGFQGDETSSDQRDWRAHPTVIDGSRARNRHRAYHVVIGADDALLDGFMITGGDATGGLTAENAGGGLYNFCTSPKVHHCVFLQNTGGGIYNFQAAPEIVSCVFEDNNGPAIFNHSSAPTIADSSFVGNHTAGMGSAIYNFYSNPVVIGTTFQKNRGQAIYNYSSAPVLTGLSFPESGGQTAPEPLVYNVASSPIVGKGDYFSGRHLMYSAPASSPKAGAAAAIAPASLKATKSIYDTSLYAADPDSGPVAGGTHIQLYGSFPVSTTITSLAAANAAYQVVFYSDYYGATVPAEFDTSAPALVTPATMNVIAPPAINLAPQQVEIYVFTLNQYGSYIGFSNSIFYWYFTEFRLDAVLPSSGPVEGGNSVQLHGSFPVAYPITSLAAAYDAYTVYFGDSQAWFDGAVPEIVGTESMYVIPPPHPAGTVNVWIVDNYEWQQTLLPSGYTYVESPRVDSIEPAQGPLAGGTLVTITGNALSSASAVYFGQVSPGRQGSNLTIISDTEIEVVTPPGASAGFVNVVVLTPTSQVSVSNGFEYTVQYYTLTVNVVGSGTTDPSAGTHVYPEGTVVSLGQSPGAGWRFGGWSGDVDPGGNTVTISGNKTVTAIFIRVFTLNVNVVGNGVTVPAAGVYIYDADTVVDLSATPSAGWRFAGWSGDVDAGENTVTMDWDKTVTATFVRVFTLTVNVVGSGTTVPGVGVHTYDTGAVVALSATPAAGWRFAGWSGDVDVSGNTVTMNADETVTATFVQTYTLTVNVVGSGTTTPAAGIYVYDAGTVVVIGTSPVEHWRFEGWSGDVTSANATSVTMDRSRTITATFIRTYALTVNMVGSGTTTPAAGTYTHDVGTVVVLSATPSAGWRFAEWSGDVDAGGTTVTMDWDKTVTATFVRVFTLTVNVVGNGTAVPEAGVHTYDTGTVVELRAVPNVGWQFTEWSGDVDAGGTTVTMDWDKTVTATFTQAGEGEGEGEGETITLVMAVRGSGTVSPTVGSHLYPPGRVVELTATAASGWLFATWVGDVASPALRNTTVTMDADKSVDAVFVPTPPPNGIAGVVWDRQTGALLEGVLVELLNAATGRRLDSDTTSQDGAYEVVTPDTDLQLRIRFVKSGYDVLEIGGLFAPMAPFNATLAPGTPVPPSGVEAWAGGNEVLVTWSPNSEPDLAGYNVYRDTGPGFQLITELLPTRSFHDTDVEARHDYSYYVTAQDRDGNESEPSDVVQVRTGVIVLWLPDVYGEPGERVRIPINARNAWGINPEGIDIVFRYDPSIVVYADETSVYVERTAVTRGVSFDYYAPEAGIVNIIGISSGVSLRGEGHLFDVYLTLRGDAPEDVCIETWLDEVSFYDPDAALLESDATDTGLVCVSPNCNHGDLDNDGRPRSSDVILALKMAVDLLTPDPCQQIAAELNGDGFIDSADALIIQRLAIGKPINPPQTGAAKWTLNDGIPTWPPKETEAKTVEIASDVAAPGETVTVPLTISDSTGLSGFDVELSFPSDERVLSLQSVAAGALTAGFKQEVNQGDGYVRVSMSSTEALEDAGGVGGDLVALTFAVTGNALIGTSLPVRVSAVELKGEYGDSLDWSFTIDKTDGVITVNEERILGVTPLEQQVGADAGTTTFEVANAGSGTTMPWAAEVTSGSAWLSIQSGTGGVDTGTIQVGFTANSSTEPRSGAVQVMAEGAEGSPAILAVIQDGAPPGEGQCQCLGGTLDIPTRAGRLRDSIGDVVLLGLVAAVLMYGILRRRSSSFP